MNNGFADKSVLEKFHQSTLMLIKPCLCDLLDKYASCGEISPPKVDIKIIADFIIYRVSAVIHADDDKSLVQKRKNIILLLKKLLED